MSANIAHVTSVVDVDGGDDYMDMDAFNAVAGNLIIVTGRWEGGGATDAALGTVTDTAGNTYTTLGYEVTGSSGEDVKVGFWFCLDCLGNASNVVRITLTANRSYKRGAADQFSYDGTIELGDTGAGNSSVNAQPWPTSPALDVLDGDVSYGVWGHYNGITNSPPTGYSDPGSSSFSVSAYKLITGTGTEQPSAQPTGDSDTYAAVTGVFQEVAAAGRIMSSLAGSGGLAYTGGIAGRGGGLAG